MRQDIRVKLPFPAGETLQDAGYVKALSLPPEAREVQVSVPGESTATVSLFQGSSVTFAKARAKTSMLTIALFCAQATLALLGFGVAFFAKLRVIGWFSWWMMSLGVISILTSGALSSLTSTPIAEALESHGIGLAASVFGLITIRLNRELKGRVQGPAHKEANWWLKLWLACLGILSALYVHPFLTGLIWFSGVAYCLWGAAGTIHNPRRRKDRLIVTLKAIGWVLAAVTIAAEITPWLSSYQTATGFGYLFPTLYSVALTAATLSKALRLERTIRRDAQRKAETGLKRVAEVVENTPVAMLSANLRGRLVSANLQARDIWPFLNWDAPGKLRVDDLLGAQYSSLLSDAFRSKGSVEAVVNLPAGIQRPKEVICQLKLFKTADSLELTLINITDQERMTRVLENQVSTDPLTRLLNRRGLDQHLQALQALVNKGEAQASMLFVDLDRFKIVNDLYGHDYGDELLVQISLRARAMSEGRLTIARIGGDEFVVLVPNASLEMACTLAEELRSVISNRPFPVREKLLTVGASIGVVRLVKGMEPKDAMIYADRACAQAKKNGRGRVERIEASDKLIDEMKSESLLQELMTTRLPTERLRIYAQPLVPLNGRAGLAYEILVRYVDDQDQVIAPGQLIAIAERQGLMSQLDFWVLQSTLDFLEKNQSFAMDTLFFTVNLSGSSINDRRFLGDILKLFERHAVVAHRVTLEITETVALLDTKYTRRFMDSMIAKGVRFALDDFGAGYTSFGYLKDLPANMLKIDGNFVSSLAEDNSARRIVRTMSTLSQQLGMQSVAEWVEDEKTLELLIDMNIDFAQGYFFSRALPVESWLTQPELIDAIQAKAQRYTKVAPPPTPQAHHDAAISALV